MSKDELFSIFADLGLFEYGAYISGAEFRNLCDIEEIEVGHRSDFDSQSLKELGFADKVRNRLLNEGKYFKQERDNYRVLLPSENAAQVMSYMNSADNKLKRGIKLNKNTPSQYKIKLWVVFSQHVVYQK